MRNNESFIFHIPMENPENKNEAKGETKGFWRLFDAEREALGKGVKLLGRGVMRVVDSRRLRVATTASFLIGVGATAIEWNADDRERQKMMTELLQGKLISERQTALEGALRAPGTLAQDLAPDDLEQWQALLLSEVHDGEIRCRTGKLPTAEDILGRAGLDEYSLDDDYLKNLVQFVRNQLGFGYGSSYDARMEALRGDLEDRFDDESVKAEVIGNIVQICRDAEEEKMRSFLDELEAR